MVVPLELSVEGRVIAALRALPGHTSEHRQSAGLLCLHGWLDNANSFRPLLPRLTGFDAVAVDLPGHGLSAHLPQGYSLVEMMVQAHGILAALDWADCHLLGHSLGGCIAPLLACAAPARIRSLILLDAAGPPSEEAAHFPARLVRVLHERQSPERFNARRFASVEDALQARLAASRMSDAAARLIVERQLKSDGNGYRWRFDPRLRLCSPFYLSEAHVQRVLESIHCPVLTIVASDGVLAAREQVARRFACFKHHSGVELDGMHHLHMDHPQQVAELIRRFVDAVETS